LCDHLECLTAKGAMSLRKGRNEYLLKSKSITTYNW